MRSDLQKKVVCHAALKQLNQEEEQEQEEQEKEEDIIYN